ncbi:MAG: hypothetical protein JO076_03390 [Verrucomicrobia bacterium]|nr:hypothetical protein [Verrucomicrobiota bacterium]
MSASESQDEPVPVSLLVKRDQTSLKSMLLFAVLTLFAVFTLALCTMVFVGDPFWRNLWLTVTLVAVFFALSRVVRLISSVSRSAGPESEQAANPRASAMK